MRRLARSLLLGPVAATLDDDPFEIGNPLLHPGRHGGCEHRIVRGGYYTGTEDEDMKRLAADAKQLL